MNIKINRQNNTITINDVLSLPIDNKIVVEFEKETLNSDAIAGGKIGDWVPVPHMDNILSDSIPCTMTGKIAGCSLTPDKFAL